MNNSRLYDALLQYVESQNYQEVDAYSFYRKIFPKGILEKEGGSEGKPNGILVTKDTSGKPTGHSAISDELNEILNLGADVEGVMAPISYYGQNLTGRNGGVLHALTITVPVQSVSEMERLLDIQTQSVLLKATYFVIAESSVQLYYVYEIEVDLTGQAQKEVLAQKQLLIDRLNELLQLVKPIKMTPLADRLPIVGSVSGAQRLPVRAFQVKLK